MKNKASFAKDIRKGLPAFGWAEQADGTVIVWRRNEENREIVANMAQFEYELKDALAGSGPRFIAWNGNMNVGFALAEIEAALNA